MPNDEQLKGDLFGLADYGKALNTLTKGAVDGAGAFLSKICLPAAEELGLLLRDKVSAWRAKNAIEIIQKTEEILENQGANNLHAHPRLVMNILMEGSWSDNSEVKSFWAGLLASSCTEDGKDESNVIFLNILSQITSLQAKIIEFGCSSASVKISEHGFLYSDTQAIDLEKLFKITQTDDLHRIDRELDHLNSLQLIGGLERGGGIAMRSGNANITPTPLALQLYARCKGHSESPEHFYAISSF